MAFLIQEAIQPRPKIDPRKLIIGVTSHDKVRVQEELAVQVAREISETTHERFLSHYSLGQYFGDEQALGEKLAAYYNYKEAGC